MSDIITKAISLLNAKMTNGFDGTAKFVIAGEGSIMIDRDGAHVGDADADVTLSASPETFHAIVNGEQNPTAAFMNGSLKVDGDMGAAMRLAGALG